MGLFDFIKKDKKDKNKNQDNQKNKRKDNNQENKKNRLSFKRKNNDNKIDFDSLKKIGAEDISHIKNYRSEHFRRIGL